MTIESTNLGLCKLVLQLGKYPPPFPWSHSAQTAHRFCCDCRSYRLGRQDCACRLCLSCVAAGACHSTTNTASFVELPQVCRATLQQTKSTSNTRCMIFRYHRTISSEHPPYSLHSCNQLQTPSSFKSFMLVSFRCMVALLAAGSALAGYFSQAILTLGLNDCHRTRIVYHSYLSGRSSFSEEKCYLAPSFVARCHGDDCNETSDPSHTGRYTSSRRIWSPAHKRGGLCHALRTSLLPVR